MKKRMELDLRALMIPDGEYIVRVHRVECKQRGTGAYNPIYMAVVQGEYSGTNLIMYSPVANSVYGGVHVARMSIIRQYIHGNERYTVLAKIEDQKVVMLRKRMHKTALLRRNKQEV